MKTSNNSFNQMSTNIATSTPTQTPTRTPTFTPSPTQPGQLSTSTPVADAYVKAANPTTKYGTATTPRTDNSPIVRSYLRFNVEGLNTTIRRATLHVYNEAPVCTSINRRRHIARPRSDISSTWYIFNQEEFNHG